MHWGQGEALHAHVCFRAIIFPCCAFERFSKHLLSVFTESNLHRVHNSGFKFFDSVMLFLFLHLQREKSSNCIGSVHIIPVNINFSLCLPAR